ncbi:hypothetical protein Nepgr_010472 [Nepenthes gracilis]|uniref:Uncharacterized protein n=1 Tax=Nepenthes gracilis TaxID=150966 RepID=A0AAD3SCS3_NEPGR|nr:hypothetical protein Nepgr_010472 [Nepenthes gracilis]
MVVDVKVAYQWRPMHRVNSRSANQKRTGKNLPAQQDAVPKNLAPGEASVGCGAPLTMDIHNDDDKSQYMNHGHAVSCQNSAFKQEPTATDHIVPLEMALHADLAKEGHVDSVLKDNF